MKMRIPDEILLRTTSDELSLVRSLARPQPDGSLDKTTAVNLSDLTPETQAEIRSAAMDIDAGKFVRVLDAVLSAETGDSDFKVPSFAAFEPLLKAFLRQAHKDGWIYEMCDGGVLRPWAVTTIMTRTPHHTDKASPRVEIHGAAYGPQDGRIKLTKRAWFFEAGNVSRRHVSKILENAGLFVETSELREIHDEAEVVFHDVIRQSFAHQFRVAGPVARNVTNGFRNRNPEEAMGSRVIMDIDPSRVYYGNDEIETDLYGTKQEPCFLNLPHHPFVEVYNLSTHESFWISVTHLQPYVYRPELREKLILPKVQRDLLDILTTDIEMLTGDLIEGKASGNVILTKGVPGVGKTLTAEIYAEVCKKPLFSVHAGNLGTTPDSIAKNLREIFQKAKRWNCILLLDEADVFVMERGRDVTQNAIVAEFLRTLEYFDGLLFMTSNRGDDIDDAILSRCAAIIQYELPGDTDLARVWKVMSDNFEACLDEEMIATLVELFPRIAPRDVKMLLRLTMRVASGKRQSLDADLFRQCAIFRGIKIKEKD